MLRLSRARLPFRRYIQTQAFTQPSRTTKYALAVGTLAAAAYLGTQTTQADSDGPSGRPAPEFNPPLSSYEVLQAQVSKSPSITYLREGLSKQPPEPASTPVQATIQTDAEGTEGSDERPRETENSPTDSEAESEPSGGDYGAFNPETGEINWDCPCLGGMAHGPCGEEFRAAFSCFVHSEDEPKGINCVEKFQGMQTCFREHPEVYASEIADDEAAEKEAEELAKENSSVPKAEVSESAPSPPPSNTPETPTSSSEQ
ncbi:coiled-coil-helix-coiled-coil-helix domain-containing protein 4 [Mycena filopes]|nr:coiled-coil-helix-coiled-coil-helix domain-containing protein 4 [Mycena filopes]